MAILKSPPKPPKNETLQIRVEEGIRAKLEKYAEFIDAPESYVGCEALKIIFRKDDEFKTWLESQSNNGRDPKDAMDSLFGATEAPGSTRLIQYSSASTDVGTNGNGILQTGGSSRQKLR